MTDRPIIFSAPMVRAILDGRKTMTRRVLREKNTLVSPWPIDSPGGELWVREAWRAHAEHDPLPPCDIPPGAAVQYVADSWQAPWLGRYRHARFMPRWASRITLRVTGVKVERLQDISDADAVAEGVEFERLHGGPDLHACDGIRAIESFRSLWSSIHGPDAWDENPWVAVISFERVSP